MWNMLTVEMRRGMVKNAVSHNGRLDHRLSAKGPEMKKKTKKHGNIS